MGRIFSCRRLLKIPGAGIGSAAGDTMRLYLPHSFFLLSAKLFAICLYCPVDAYLAANRQDYALNRKWG
jgi:hypothetical protein